MCKEKTMSTVLETTDAGPALLFGLGFPTNSPIVLLEWHTLIL